MRSDMKHVLIDRPRVGGHGAKESKLFKDLEDAPSHESMTKRYTDRKDFSDHIHPLYKFLNKNVGRPWDKVYSEIREFVGPNSTMDMHLLQHVRGFVEMDVEMVGKVAYRTVAGYPLESTRRYNTLYVHPVTGLLCRAPFKKKVATPKQVTLVILPDRPGIQYRLKQRVVRDVPVSFWVAVTLGQRPVPTRVPTYAYRYTGVTASAITGMRDIYDGRDAFFNQSLDNFTPRDSQFYYGNPNLYAVKIRAVTRVELRAIKRVIES